MQDVAQRLQQVDRVEVLTLVDNYVDLLLPGGAGVKRPPFAKNGEIPRSSLLAEHGISLLVTVHRAGKSHSVLLDTGYNPATMLHNMAQLNVDPGTIEAVVLSHGHMDHTGGLTRLLERLGRSVSVVAHPDVFRKRCLIRPGVGRANFPVTAERTDLQERNARLVKAVAPVYLAEDMILVSGEIPRTTGFETGLAGAHMQDEGSLVPDPIADDQALIVRLAGHGLVVVSGCAHSGIINSILYAMQLTGESRVAAVIGGFHLLGPDMEPVIEETQRRLKDFSPGLVMPMHCTGWNAMGRLQKEFPDSFVLTSVGTQVAIPREA